ncbi:conserved hypothetical protein [Paraburkholderia tropica]|uniref:hypothetical protein n=1 Tax=Paraburkholderia tropica TaxID=92647 RepID=UPI001CAD3484|nr:hypothetical protein [Paraburkholderia tropica]CAG9235762.1 conserved hypothetical protein [Paraburkholderia tropica]
MSARFQLVVIALPPDLPPEAVPEQVRALVAACWAGMSRAQLLDRARRFALRASMCPLAGLAPDGCARFALRLALPDPLADAVPSTVAAAAVIELIAHVRRLARRRAGARRAKVSLPPARDARQMGLF